MNILITGAGGYIGAKLTQFLAWKEHNIVCFDNFFFNHKTLVEDVFDRPNCKLYEEDVTEWSDTLKREIKNADVIFPLAALVGAPLCDKFPQETLDLNQNWFNKLLDYVDNQVIIYPNTNSGYGSTGTEICTEETPCNPLSLYGKTKGEAERILLEDYDNAVCFRLATVYGRSHRQRMDLLVNNLVYSSMVNKRLEVFDGHFRRNYIHVDDIVSAFAHALDNFESMRGEVYNLGNDSVNMSKLDLVKKICHETRAEWSEVQDKTDPDKRDYVVSSQKLYDTGFKPVYNLDYGIRQMMMVCSENWQNFANEAYMNMCKNY